MSDDPQNLVPLRPHNISPAVILQEAQKNLESIEEIFIVTFDKDGQEFVYMSGDLKNMVYAGHVLNGLAHEIARDTDE